MKKRGKSKYAQAQVITAILLILIVFVIIVIVWNVFKGVVQKSSEEISIEQFKVDLDIKSVYIPEDNQTAYVSVHRDAGKGNISALKFIFTDSREKNYIYNYPSFSGGIPDELETKVYSITQVGVRNQIGDPSFNFSDIVFVSIAFEIQISSGKIITSAVKDKFKKDLRKDTSLPNKVNTDVYEGSGEGTFECVDNDGDGFNATGESCGSVDCNDSNININPGANEICDDGVDNDCDGSIDYYDFEDCQAGILDIASQGLVAYYKFNNDSDYGETDNLAYDFSGNGNSATCSVNCPSFVEAGKVNGAFDFEYDNGQSFIVQDSPELQISEEITLSAWIKPEDKSGKTQRIINKGTDDAYGYRMALTNDLNPELGLKIGGSPTAYQSSNSIESGKWYFLTMTYNYSDNEWKIYINGELDNSGLPDVSGPIDTGSYDLRIGARASNDRFFDGMIDEAAIWNRSLSEEEIKEIYENVYGGVIPEPTLSYYLEPYVMAWNETTEKIRTETNMLTNITINYGETIGYGNSVSDSSFSKIHELTINSLNPGTVYYYQVIVQNISDGEIYKNDSFKSSFKTLDNSKTSFSFAFLGDSRGCDGICAEVGCDGGDLAFESMINDIASKGADFVIIGGDDIQGEGCSQESDYRTGWKNFHDLTSGLRGDLSIPLLSAIGNHELYGGWNFGHQAYQDYWIAPLNGGGATNAFEGKNNEWQEVSYSWGYGNSLFIFVNTEEAGNEGDITGNQFTWFDETLHQEGYTHKFVIGHRPLVATTRDDCLMGFNPTRSAMIDDLMYNKEVTASLFSHEHVYNYNSTHDGEMINIISGGAGAPLRACETSTSILGDCIGHNFHYVIINITNNVMNGIVYNDTGDIIDTFERTM